MTLTHENNRDHGGGLDAALKTYGGSRADWIDLSTGINPVPYPIGDLELATWTDLPDESAFENVVDAARRYWNVPKNAAILPAPGASALIARLPALAQGGKVHIPAPTYNEHAAAFSFHGWTFSDDDPDACVLVHPNNPTGHWYSEADLNAPFCIVDESFADVTPERSLVHRADQKGVTVLKSFGKFWGLAGVRLGFAIGDPVLVQHLSNLLGPWAVSGPALQIAETALRDFAWAETTRDRLKQDALRLDTLMFSAGAKLEGGTTLFRLYNVGDAEKWHTRLAEQKILTRIFPYSKRWLRLGLPAPGQWDRLERAL